MEETRIHPETGEMLRRDVRAIELRYKGEKITVDLPGWYPAENNNGICSQEDAKITNEAMKILKARHEAKMQENNLNFTKVAFA